MSIDSGMDKEDVVYIYNDRMISLCLQGKPFNITVIQVYAPTSNTEEELKSSMKNYKIF